MNQTENDGDGSREPARRYVDGTGAGEEGHRESSREPQRRVRRRNEVQPTTNRVLFSLSPAVASPASA